MQNRNLPLFILVTFTSLVFLVSCERPNAVDGPSAVQAVHNIVPSTIYLQVRHKQEARELEQEAREPEQEVREPEQEAWELVVDEEWTKPQNCRFQGRDRLGCILGAEHTIPLVTFHFRGSGGWAFTELRICMGDAKPNSDDPSQPCKLTEEQMNQFFVIAGNSSNNYPDGDNGAIDLTSIEPDLDEFSLLDKNSFAQDYFYIIKACKDGECLYTDPPIDNRGGSGI